MGAGEGIISLPWFEDVGHEGTWLEHLAFSPWLLELDTGLCNSAFLKARNDAGGDHTNRLGPALSPFFHSPADTPGEANDHA